MLLAEEIVARVDPVEQVRLVSSGTEATMSAIRLARGFTGRSLVVKFAGHYHGHVDCLLVSAGSGRRHPALPDSAGVPKEMAAETLVIPYNDVEAARGRLRRPRRARSPASSPRPPPATWASSRRMPGSPQALRRVTAEHGALLVSDEVMTGFRVGRAGWWGHEGVDVAPDLMTFGKVMGGGFPAAAFGGRADVMALLAPDGPVYQAGTLSGNPVATAAGLATLRACDDALYAAWARCRARSPTRHPGALSDAGVPHRHPVGRVDVLASTSATAPCAPTTTRATRTPPPSAAFFHAMLDAGVYLPPSAFESWFVSGAHDDAAARAGRRRAPGGRPGSCRPAGTRA